MNKRTVFVELLKTVATGQRFSGEIPVDQPTIDVFVAAGLGPLLCSELDKSGLLEPLDPSRQLRAASLTSRVMTRELIDNVCVIVDLLRGAGMHAVVLKGVSFALRYYDEPHLRLMGDLDLLLIDGQTREAEQLLLANGFQFDDTHSLDYNRHIHSAPLFSPKRQIWVEPHRRLIPDHFEASREAPLDLRQLDRYLQSIRIDQRRVAVLSPEFELVYLATGWFRDLAHGFRHARAQRGLVDMAVLLRSTGEGLNWEIILRWSRGTQTGACLFLMLSFIKRLGAFDDDGKICRQLRRHQPCINPLVTSVIHGRLEKHVLAFGNFGRLLTASVNQQLFATLIRQRPAWRNLLSLPWDLLFPTDQADRYDLQRLLGRLATLVRAK